MKEKRKMGKFWRRHTAPTPEPIVEQIPTILMHGEKIVEVGFTEWWSEDGVTWSPPPDGFCLTLDVSEPADRIIVELPIGCMQEQFSTVELAPGDSLCLTFQPGPGGAWTRCQRPGLMSAPAELPVTAG